MESQFNNISLRFSAKTRHVDSYTIFKSSIDEENMVVEVKILPVSREDLETIYEIELECFGGDAYPKYLFEYMLEKKYTVFLKAVVDNVIAGFILATYQSRECTILTINVRKAYRNMGVGSILLKTLENEIVKKNVEKILLQVEVSNRVAVEFYLKRGYMISRLIKNYYGLGRDAYEAFKKL